MSGCMNIADFPATKLQHKKHNYEEWMENTIFLCSVKYTAREIMLVINFLLKQETGEYQPATLSY